MEAAQHFSIEVWLWPVAGVGGGTGPCVEVWQSADLMIQLLKTQQASTKALEIWADNISRAYQLSRRRAGNKGDRNDANHR